MERYTAQYLGKEVVVFERETFKVDTIGVLAEVREKTFAVIDHNDGGWNKSHPGFARWVHFPKQTYDFELAERLFEPHTDRHMDARPEAVPDAVLRNETDVQDS